MSILKILFLRLTRQTDRLIELLAHEDVAVQVLAVKALGNIGDSKAVEHLIPLLKDEDSEVRKGTAEALGEIGDPRVVEPLLRSLQVFERNVRAARKINRHLENAAAQALVMIGEPAVEPLMRALHNKDIYIRKGAAEALGKIGDIGEAAVEPLLRSLPDASSPWWIVRALADIGKPAVESLIRALQDEDREIRWDATVVLDRLGWEPSDIETKTRYYYAKRVWPMPLDIGCSEAEVLIHTQSEDNEDVRKGTARALVKTGDLSDPAVERLIRRLQSTNFFIRRYDAKALGEIGDPKAVEPLIPLLKDEDNEVQRLAAEALGEIGDPRAVEPLIRALLDKDALVRKKAAEALGKIGDIGEAAMEPILRALQGEDVFSRLYAVEALGELGDPWAVEPLMRALMNQLNLRWAHPRMWELDIIGESMPPIHLYRNGIVQALSKIGEPALLHLHAVLQDKKKKSQWDIADSILRTFKWKPYDE